MNFNVRAIASVIQEMIAKGHGARYRRITNEEQNVEKRM